MNFNIESIETGKRHLPPRIVLLGTPKVGKTTFACGAHNPIVIPIKGEEGSDDLDVPRFPVVTSLLDLMAALQTLAEQAHTFETVIIDSSSTLEPLVWDHTIANAEAIKGAKPKSIERVGGGYAKGYIAALNHWAQIIECLDYLRNNKNMTSIVIGHVIVKQFNDPMCDPYDQFMWSIHHKAAASFMRWADSVLFAKFESFVSSTTEGEKKIRKATGAGNRNLYTQERPAHPGGGRGVYGRLPYQMDLTWQAFAEAIGGVE